MPRFNIDITVGVNQSTLAQAEGGFKKIGLSADDAAARVKALATDTNASTQAVSAATLKAVAALGKFGDASEIGGGRAARSYTFAKTTVEELRASIERAQKAGAPVDPHAAAVVEQLDKATKSYAQTAAHVNAEMEESRKQLKDSSAGYTGQVQGLNSLEGILDHVGGGFGKLGLQALAAWEALKTGWEIGTKVREILEAIAPSIAKAIDISEPAARAVAALQGIKEAGEGDTTAAREAEVRQRLLEVAEAAGKAGNAHLGAIADALRWHEVSDVIKDASASLQFLVGKVALMDEGMKPDRADALVTALEKLRASGVKVNSVDDERVKQLADLILESKAYSDEIDKGRQKQDDAAAAAKKLSDAEQGIAAGAKMAQQALQLAYGGATEQHIKALQQAAQALGRHDLLDPLVQQWAKVAEGEILAEEKLKSYYAAINAAPKQIGTYVGSGSGLGTVETKPFEDDVNRQLAAAQASKEFADYARQLNDELDKEADRWRQYGKTVEETFDDQKRIIEARMRDGRLTTEEGQAAIERLTEEFWVKEANTFASSLSALGSIFGGFVQELADDVRKLYSAAQSGSSAGKGIASLFGAGEKGQAAGGVVGAEFAIALEIVAIGNQMVAEERARQYDNPTTYNLIGNTSGGTELESYSHQITQKIQSVIHDFESALHIDVQTLDQIGISVRNDGKNVEAFVKGQLIGVFANVDDAVQAAVQSALTNGDAVISGLSDLMRLGLQDVHFSNFDDFKSFLEQLREIGDMNVDDAVAKMRDTAQHVEDLWETLLKIPSHLMEQGDIGTFLGGVNDLLGGLTGGLQSLYDELTGHKQTLAEERQAQADAFQAQKAIVYAQLVLMEQEIKARIAEYQAMQLFTNLYTPHGGGGANPGSGASGNAPGNDSPVAPGDHPQKTAAGGGDPAHGGTSPPPQGAGTDAGLQALLNALAAIESAITGLPPDISPGDIHTGRGGRGGGGGGGNITKADRAQFIADARERIGLATGKISELDDQKKQINDKYDAEEKGLKKTSDQYKALEALRQQELDIATKAAQTNANAELADVLGKTNVFTQLHDKFDGVRKDLHDAGRDTVANLAALTAAEQQQEAILADQGLATIFGNLAGMLADGVEKSAIVADQQKLNWIVQLEQLRDQLDLYESLGKLTGKMKDDAEAAYTAIVNAGPPTADGSPQGAPPWSGNRVGETTWSNGSMWRWDGTKWVLVQTGGSGANGGGGSTANPQDDARKLLQQYQEDLEDPLRRSIEKIVTDFNTIRTALGDTAEVQQAYARAIRQAIDQYLDPVRRAQQELQTGEQSIYDPEQQYQLVLQRAQAARARFNAGDYTDLSDVGSLVQQLLQAEQAVTPVGSEGYADSFREWNSFLNQVLALSNNPQAVLGSQTNPMAVAGLNDLTAINQNQLTALDSIDSTNKLILRALSTPSSAGANIARGVA